MHASTVLTSRAALALIVLSSAAGTASASVVVRSGTGADAASIQGVVDQFRSDLGDLNANEPGTRGDGRRQINWDAAPDGVSAPNGFDGDFFNANFSPRARGIEFSTDGAGFQLSAPQASGEGVRFANINGAYEDMFSTFSEERLFTAVGSNVIDVEFFVAGTNTRATTRGFGAVFTDVDVFGSTFIEYFNADGVLIGTYNAEAGPTADGSLSFIGASWDEAIVGSVRIYSGNEALGGLEGNGVDLVVMDDFIFGEPVPAPAGALALALGAAPAMRRRR